jgi:hypothetical protein
LILPTADSPSVILNRHGMLSHIDIACVMPMGIMDIRGVVAGWETRGDCRDESGEMEGIYCMQQYEM